MAKCPFAVWRPLPENSYQSKIKPRAVILHTAVDAPGPTDLWKYFARGDVGAESHFYVRIDGTIEQFMDTNVKANANRKADPFAISIETEDEGRPEEKPWTPAQVDAIVKLLTWICDEHNIPKQLIPDPYGSGIGYHSQFNDSSGRTPWSLYAGKTCPGTARKPQIPGIIERVKNNDIITGGGEVVTEEDIEKVAKRAAELIVPKLSGSGIASLDDDVNDHGDLANHISEKVGGVYNRVNEVGLWIVASLSKDGDGNVSVPTHIDDDDLERIAKAVADEQARRLND